MQAQKIVQSVLRLLCLTSVIFLSTPIIPVHANGAPYQPTLISPANGSLATSNPPMLCARNNGDPEGEQVWVRFGMCQGFETS